ncbi:metallophosphoesterase [Tenacibaculum sp. MEBiC06402]|uniref:metallophosphoesterase n=1 Tax=unclassified Tenacibaculum TaxID=2635139 RepID=UPI003B9D26C0
MKSYSLFKILLVCIAILIVDIAAFYWLQKITQLIVSEKLETLINILFWIFTSGLITAIILLKIRLDNINPERKYWLVSSLFGLTVSSFIPKIVFVIFITFLYLTNYLFTEKESQIIVPLSGLLSGFLPFFAILYGIFKTRYRFKVYHETIKIHELPKAFNGLKIVQISDIHLGSFNYKYSILENAFNIINELNPDYIFITGDLVNNYAWELKGWENIFLTLKATKGKYAVLGNHDYGDYSDWDSEEDKLQNFNSIKQFYKTINFYLLLNDAEIVTQHNEQIAIIGVENWGNPPFKRYGNLKKAHKLVKNIPFKMLLTHDPSHWEEEIIYKTGINLTFSGHTHGMQAGFQYKKYYWSPIQYKYKHWAGLYEINNQYLYVNRGLGWLSFPGRLGMPPEITCITLKK